VRERDTSNTPILVVPSGRLWTLLDKRLLCSASILSTFVHEREVKIYFFLLIVTIGTI
jgi:hypothetical protein